MDKTLEQAVIETVAETLEKDPGGVTADMDFIADLGMDSLEVVEMVMALEDRFECEIPDEAVESIKTVGQAVEYIRRRRQEAVSG